MSYYVTIKNPYRIGESIACVPTGKTRTENGKGTEAECRVITPQTNMDTIWITREDLIN
jgi:hypothetical protein